MKRRHFLLGAAACAAALPLGHAASRPTVGVIATDVRNSTRFAPLSDALRAMGYVEGRTVEFRLASAEGDPARLPQAAAELLRSRVDVVFASGPAAIRAMKAASSTVPIVALDLESDPVAMGWAASLARPGGNVTGLFFNLPSVIGKWFELLKEMDPRLRRVVLVWDSAAGHTQLPASGDIAARLGLELDVREVRTMEDIAGVIARTGRDNGRDNGRGLVFLSSPTISRESPALARMVADKGIPAISAFRLFPDSGGLASYGPRADDIPRQLAHFVARILKGANPGELPIEQPARFELVVNTRAAGTLGIVVPVAVLARADEVIR